MMISTVLASAAFCVLVLGYGCYGSPTLRETTLSCYSCQNTGIGSTCDHTQTCAHSQGACITEISMTGSDTKVTQACASIEICTEAQNRNADECNWESPAIFGYEGKCSYCCKESGCNHLLPTNFPDMVMEEGVSNGKDTSILKEDTAKSGSSNGGGKGCHSHDNQPCCQGHSARSVDVEIKVHVGSGDAQKQQTNNGRQVDNNSGPAIMSVTKTTDKPTDKPATAFPTSPLMSTPSTTPSSTHQTSPRTTQNPTTATNSTVTATTPTTISTTKPTAPSTQSITKTTLPPSTPISTTKKTTTTTKTTTTATTAKPTTTTATTTMTTTTTMKPTTTPTTQSSTTTTTKPTTTTTTTTSTSATTPSTTTKPSTTTRKTTTTDTTTMTPSTTMSTTVPVITTHEPYYCYVCADPVCGTQRQKLCDRDAEFCMSTVDQLQDGTRIVSKGCVKEDVCASEWWQKTASRPECITNITDDARGPPNMPIKCSFCCTDSLCNEFVKPSNPLSYYYKNTRK